MARPPHFQTMSRVITPQRQEARHSLGTCNRKETLLDQIPFKFFWIMSAVFMSTAQLPAQIFTTRCDIGELAENAAPAVAVDYLSGDRQNLNSACIVKAIRIIKDQRYEPAIPVFIKYLDFKKPWPPGVPMAIRRTQGPTNGLYPAVDALASLGEASVPVFLKEISNEDQSKDGHLNAAKAALVMTNYQVRVIKTIIEAAQFSQNLDAAQSLKDLARMAVRYCSSEEQQQCKDAVSGQ